MSRGLGDVYKRQTHYPLLEKSFKESLGPNVKVFSQASLVAESLHDYLQRHPNMKGSATASKFITTGDPKKVSDRATQFLKRKIDFERF